MRLPESSSISLSVRDALAVIHRQALELIVQGASLETVWMPSATASTPSIQTSFRASCSQIPMASASGRRRDGESLRTGSNSLRHFRSGRAWARAAQRRFGRSA